MQPTDHESGRFSCFSQGNAKAARRIEREPSNAYQGLVKDLPMKAKMSRVVMALATVAMIALAGGASLRGF